MNPFQMLDVNMLSVVKYKWPKQYDDQVFAKSDDREYYQFGDPLLVWDESLEEIQYLGNFHLSFRYIYVMTILFHIKIDIPWPLYASNCRIKSPLKHLVDDEIQCVQNFDVHDQFIIDLQTKLKSIKVLKHRKPFYTPSIVMKDFCKSIQTVNDTENCIDINVYHCIDMISLRTCKHDGNATIATVPEFGENFITDKLSIQIHHNFTNLLNVTVFFVYSELNNENPITQIVQRISLEYLETNETFATRDAYQISGNIGYLPHKPIIITKFIQPNESVVDSATNMDAGFLAYFHNETNCTNDDHYLKIPAIDSNGDCIVNNNTFQTVNFYENTRVKCNAVVALTEFNDTNNSEQPINVEVNNTYICRKFQRKIFDYLLHSLELKNANSTVYNQFNSRISEMGKNHFFNDLHFATKFIRNFKILSMSQFLFLCDFFHRQSTK